MRYLISGSRTWTEWNKIHSVMDTWSEDFDVLIHGACKTGADAIASKYARTNGISQDDFPAKWGFYGPAAGNIRNQQMIDEGKLDAAHCFWDGRSPGTKDMIERLLKHNIPHTVVAKKNQEQYVQDRYYELTGLQVRLF